MSSDQVEPPDIAVFTNLSPDHLDRHGGMGGYFAAKRRLFAEGGPDRAVVGVDEAEGLYLANPEGGYITVDQFALVTVTPYDGGFVPIE